MIVLDTNVISEVFKPTPAAGVLHWLQQQDDAEMFTTAVTRGELMYGLNVMADGKRREMLVSGLEGIFAQRFAGRVLPYDEPAADAYAEILAQRRRIGRPTGAADAMIAGIVHSHGAALATRNLRDFEGCGLTLINPWR